MKALAALVLSLPFFAATPALAQTNNGASVVAQVSVQDNYQVISDGAGGSFVVWDDLRNGQHDIYAQRLDSSGGPLWGLGGKAVCSAAGTQRLPQLSSDGTGGIIVCWEDARTGANDIYAQRMNGSGATQWSFSGVAVSSASNGQDIPRIATDGTGGAIIVWRDVRFGNQDVFAQRINGAGVAQWTIDGAAVCTQGSTQDLPIVTNEGSGGAIFAWQDYRSGASDVYAQRLNTVGVPQWSTNGIPVCGIAGTQSAVRMISDGSSGVFLAWADDRTGTGRIYAQHLNGLGVSLWTTDGAAVATPPASTFEPQLVSNGTGGIIVSWHDARSATNDIYAQMMGDTGTPQWSANGVTVCAALSEQSYPTIARDSAGGAIITWQDARFGNYDIYAQRLAATGVRLWDLDGVPLCNATSTQDFPRIAADGMGGAVAVWRDSRFSPTTSYDLFAQRVDSFGIAQFPDAEYPAMISVDDVPNDQGGRVKVSWVANIQDLAPFNQVVEYWMWRSVPSSAVAARARGVAVIEEAQAAIATRNDIVATRVEGDEYFWEFLDAQPAGHLYRYSYVAATTSDSMAGSNPHTAFMVQARNDNGTSWWYSNPDSGYSVDNLAPPAPQNLVAVYQPTGAALHWLPTSAPDLGVYRIYRGTSEDFVPDEGSLLATLPDTGYVDPTPDAYYYRVAVVDIHGNEGPSALAGPSGVLEVRAPGGLPSIWLAPASPNPVRQETTIAFSAPAGHVVSLALYDAAGRRTRLLHSGMAAGGTLSIRWDGTDDQGRRVGDGVYWALLDVEGVTTTRRLVVLH